MPDAPATPEIDDADDLGADLSKNWDAAEAAPADPAASPSVGTLPPETASTEATPTGEAAARARDAAGKFTKAEKAAIDAKAPPVPGAPAAAEFKIPDKWPAPVKERLAAMHAINPEHAQFVLEQYEHFRKIDGHREAQFKGQFKAFDDLLAPGRPSRALKNVDDISYVRNLIAAGDILDKNPVEGLKWLAKNYGIPLERLANPDAAAEPGTEIPSYARQQQQELAQIKQFIAAQNQQAQTHQLQQAASWIDGFAKQKDAQGQPLYPYFDELLPEIVVNVQYQRDSGQAVDVAAAYRRAERMNDSVWLKKQAASSEVARKATEAQRLRDIEDAKRAAITVSGSGAGTVQSVPDDIGEHLSRVWDSQSH